MFSGEKTYLVSPFELKKWGQAQIVEQVNEIINRYDSSADTMYEMAKQVDLLSDLLYLYGEMIARLTENHELIKIRNDNKENKEVYRQRSNWTSVSKEKAPAMSYFEALASEIVEKDRQEEAELKADLTRFKKAYESIETKQNAIKKKMDAVKFESL